MKNPRNPRSHPSIRSKKIRPPLRRIVRFVLFFLSSAWSISPALAGYVYGPYVVWVNLDQSAKGKLVDQKIREFFSDESTTCNGDWIVGQSWLYMKKRPKNIDNDLVKRVFLEKDRASQKDLHKLLRNYKDELIDDGFDGIIVYLRHKGEAKMMEMTVGKNKITSYTLALSNEQPEDEMIKNVFCGLLPPKTRAP